MLGKYNLFDLLDVVLFLSAIVKKSVVCITAMRFCVFAQLLMCIIN